MGTSPEAAAGALLPPVTFPEVCHSGGTYRPQERQQRGQGQQQEHLPYLYRSPPTLLDPQGTSEGGYLPSTELP